MAFYAFGAGVIWWLLSKINRRKKLLLAGQCVACGYDLRASPDICPECGTPRSA